MNRILQGVFVLLVCSVAFAASPPTASESGSVDWPVYGGDSGGSKYSALKQIDRRNVATLKEAWRFSTGEPTTPLSGPGSYKTPAFEATPIVIDGVMYIGTPYGGVFAIDAVTGAKKWSYDARIARDGNYGDFANRGVSTWLGPDAKAGAPCQRRIFFASIDARLTALDAATGLPCADFGQASGSGKPGEIDLKVGLRRGPEYMGEYEETSPPAIIDDLVVVGSAIADNHRAESPTGEVRAFDARTGRLRWTWHPLSAEITEHAGQANAWTVISTDPQRNLVILSTGSSSPDYFGGLRPGDDRDANSVVALNAKDGTRVWGFQTVHHDLWDYDLASQPTLCTVRREGKDVPAVAVASKSGHVFVLDRVTGKPLFAVEERAVPASDVEGEHASPTQPIPVLPKPWVRQRLTADDAWGPTDDDREACRKEIAGMRSEGVFTPPSLKGSLLIPGNIGGMQWGGVAWDRDHDLLIVPSNNLAAVARLIPREKFTEERKANRMGFEMSGQRGAAYAMTRHFLRAPSGALCTPPPWGELVAVDLTTGAIKWQRPVGEIPFVPDQAMAAKFGSVIVGGPIVTGGGLVFMGATFDSFLKAFDVETGKELWRGALPTSARAVPMTYQVRGKQYVAIAAGGHESITKADNTIVVFSLP
jgi:quinoprotein glucose dehydrogenase